MLREAEVAVRSVRLTGSFVIERPALRQYFNNQGPIAKMRADRGTVKSLMENHTSDEQPRLIHAREVSRHQRQVIPRDALHIELLYQTSLCQASLASSIPSQKLPPLWRKSTTLFCTYLPTFSSSGSTSKLNSKSQQTARSRSTGQEDSKVAGWWKAVEFAEKRQEELLQLVYGLRGASVLDRIPLRTTLRLHSNRTDEVWKEHNRWYPLSTISTNATTQNLWKQQRGMQTTICLTLRRSENNSRLLPKIWRQTA